MGLADVKGESSGFYVVTPFVLENNNKSTNQQNEKILVNRGWIPASFVAKEKTDYAISEGAKRFVNGTVKIVGIFTPGEDKNTFSPPNSFSICDCVA